MKAGFAETDITPPLGTRKIGWLRDIVGESVRDPLFARVFILESAGERIAFVQLDTLSISRKHVAGMRRRIESQFQFPGRNIMFAATHNHAGPAITRIGAVSADPAYVESVSKKIVAAFKEALQQLQDCEIAIGHAFNFEVPNNRRVVTRSGITLTHGSFTNPQALYVEGPVDPELTILAVRSKAGDWLGCLINFTCHPVHWGWDTTFSAGWPGVLANEMKHRGFPVPLFVNGALGQISTSDPKRPGHDLTMEHVGASLAADAAKALQGVSFRGEVKLASRSQELQLPFREATEEQIKGTARGAQRFVDPAVYEAGMPALLAEIKTKGTQIAEVQALFIDEYAFVGIPAEFFVELGLRIKEQAHPRHAQIVGLANGMVGYVPTKEAFARGGYETTFIASSKLGPEAGSMLVDAALRLIRAGG